MVCWRRDFSALGLNQVLSRCLIKPRGTTANKLANYRRAQLKRGLEAVIHSWFITATAANKPVITEHCSNGLTMTLAALQVLSSIDNLKYVLTSGNLKQDAKENLINLINQKMKMLPDCPRPALDSFSSLQNEILNRLLYFKSTDMTVGYDLSLIDDAILAETKAMIAEQGSKALEVRESSESSLGDEYPYDGSNTFPFMLLYWNGRGGLSAGDESDQLYLIFDRENNKYEVVGEDDRSYDRFSMDLASISAVGHRVGSPHIAVEGYVSLESHKSFEVYLRMTTSEVAHRLVTHLKQNTGKGWDIGFYPNYTSSDFNESFSKAGEHKDTVES